MNRTITSTFRATNQGLPFTISQNGEVNPYVIKKSGPNVHTFKFMHEPSNFQARADDLLKRLDEVVYL